MSLEEQTQRKEKILVIDDEEDILELVSYNLSREGYEVSCATTGEKGLELAKSSRPDLAIVDLMLPGIPGLEVCRVLRAREETSDLPLIILSAKGDESDVVAGLEIGADDYVTKPFSPKVLLARARAVARRKQSRIPTDTESLKIENLLINPGKREVLVDSEPVTLTFTEFGILHLLARRPGWVFTRYKIVDSVRGEDHAVTERAVDVQIVGLRKKLGTSGALIETVRGVGYRFKELS